MANQKIQRYTYKYVSDACKEAESKISKIKDKEIKDLREEKDQEISILRKENNRLKKDQIETLEKENKELKSIITKNAKKVKLSKPLLTVLLSSVSVISITVLYIFKIIGLEEIKLLIDAALRIFLG